MKTIAFFVYPAGSVDPVDVCAALLARSAWFTVDPYPSGIYRFDVKPETAPFLRSIPVSEVAP